MHPILRARGQRVRLYSPTVVTCARESQNVLPEVIGKADHGQWLARGHHPPIVASPKRRRPSSTGLRQTLYIERERG